LPNSYSHRVSECQDGSLLLLNEQARKQKSSNHNW
jgi:hypothetical protein